MASKSKFYFMECEGTTNEQEKSKLSENFLQKILNKYADPALQTNNVLLWTRLERAVINQLSNGDATLSRYTHWLQDLRNHILKAYELIENNKNEEAKPYLLETINSIAAFSEIQVHFDPLNVLSIEDDAFPSRKA